MKEKPNTNITVRVQARGGMFLGPDSYAGAIITIKNYHTQEVIASGFTDDGDSGSRSPAYRYNAAPAPIITPTTPMPTIYWLVASPTTVKFSKSIYLAQPTLLEISARVPLPPEQGDQFTSATQWVIPGIDLTVGPGFALEIPGLWVQPEIVNNGKEVRVRAKVTMMCGCEINKNSPWLPQDFKVTATFKSTKKSKKPFQKTVKLSFEDNSQFVGQFTLPKKGDYETEIIAYQKSTGNVGFAVKGFSTRRNPPIKEE